MLLARLLHCFDVAQQLLAGSRPSTKTQDSERRVKERLENWNRIFRGQNGLHSLLHGRPKESGRKKRKAERALGPAPAGLQLRLVEPPKKWRAGVAPPSFSTLSALSAPSAPPAPATGHGSGLGPARLGAGLLCCDAIGKLESLPNARAKSLEVTAKSLGDRPLRRCTWPVATCRGRLHAPSIRFHCALPSSTAVSDDRSPPQIPGW